MSNIIIEEEKEERIFIVKITGLSVSGSGKPFTCLVGMKFIVEKSSLLTQEDVDKFPMIYLIFNKDSTDYDVVSKSTFDRYLRIKSFW